MLQYRGHMFDALPVCTCCTTDAQAVLTDPTGTGTIRRLFRTTARIKWQQLRVLVREMLISNDLLSLKSGGLLSVSTTAIVQGASKVDAFQRWLDYAAEKVVLETTGGWMRSFITRGYADGQAFGQGVVGAAHINLNAQAREDVISALAKVELQGIIEAVSQQAVRAVANGLLHNDSARQIVATITAIIDRIGITRTNTMVELLVVKAFGEATLDVYSAMGITDVGLIVEADAAMLTDAKKKAPKKKKSKAKKASGPGSRSRGRTPSKRTIQRIAAAQRQLEALGMVNVRTAEDDDVCIICQDIAEEGPYSIDTARSLIPAHPHCRCVFVPVKDKRFGTRKRKSLDAFDFNENHDPHSGQFSSGTAGEGGRTALVYKIAKTSRSISGLHSEHELNGGELQLLKRIRAKKVGDDVGGHHGGNPNHDPKNGQFAHAAGSPFLTEEDFVVGDAHHNAKKFHDVFLARGNKVRIVQRTGGHTGSYTPTTDMMEVNERHPYFHDPVGMQREAFKAGRVSSPHPMHFVFHEEGHKLTIGRTDFLGTPKQKAHAVATIKKRLSTYGATNPSELAAEVHAAKMAGRGINPAVQKLHDLNTVNRAAHMASLNKPKDAAPGDQSEFNTGVIVEVGMYGKDQ